MNTIFYVNKQINVKHKQKMSNFITNVTSEAVDNMYGGSQATNNYEPKNPFNPDNYLNTSLGKGEKSKKITIRILPISATDSRPFVEIKTHSRQVSELISKSKFKTYVCTQSPNLEVDGEKEKCPLCAKGNHYYALSKAEENPEAKKKYYLGELNKPENFEGLSEKEAQDLREYYMTKANEAPNKDDAKAYMDKAKTFFSKKTYICRVIERGNEAQGPKFWRFNARNDEGDPYSQIKEIYETRKEERGGNYNIYDLANGKDLILKITPSSSGKGVAINVTDAGIESPLSTDIELANSWINDSKVWKDMYSIKNAAYLSIVAEGLIPVWDKSEGRYVGKTEDEMKNGNATTSYKKDEPTSYPQPATRVESAPSATNDGSSEDLPF